MNHTRFTIYTSGVDEATPPGDIKTHALTRELYVRNCDCKMAGNLSSIYQTLISLLNLSQDSFYYKDEIVNTFLEKMEGTIGGKVSKHQGHLARHVLGAEMPAQMLAHILADKFQRSSVPQVVQEALTREVVESLLRHVVAQKFEQRVPSGDVYDEFILFLSGEQESLMEISYTKQQQKQKQKQQNKQRDSDTMEAFDKNHQLVVPIETDNYFQYTLTPETDFAKIALSLPLSFPIFSVSYTLGGRLHVINVYPTLQFLYSHYIQAAYITRDVKALVDNYKDPESFCAAFLEAVAVRTASDSDDSVLGVGKTVTLCGLSDEAYNGLVGMVISKVCCRPLTAAALFHSRLFSPRLIARVRAG